MTEQEFDARFEPLSEALDDLREIADVVHDLLLSATHCQAHEFTAAAEGLLEKAERLLNGSETAKA